MIGLGQGFKVQRLRVHRKPALLIREFKRWTLNSAILILALGYLYRTWILFGWSCASSSFFVHWPKLELLPWTCERLRNDGTIGNDLYCVKDAARYPRKAALERFYCYRAGVSYLSSVLWGNMVSKPTGFSSWKISFGIALLKTTCFRSNVSWLPVRGSFNPTFRA